MTNVTQESIFTFPMHKFQMIDTCTYMANKKSIQHSDKCNGGVFWTEKYSNIFKNYTRLTKTRANLYLQYPWNGKVCVSKKSVVCRIFIVFWEFQQKVVYLWHADECALIIVLACTSMIQLIDILCMFMSVDCRIIWVIVSFIPCRQFFNYKWVIW